MKTSCWSLDHSASAFERAVAVYGMTPKTSDLFGGFWSEVRGWSFDQLHRGTVDQTHLVACVVQHHSGAHRFMAVAVWSHSGLQDMEGWLGLVKDKEKEVRLTGKG